METVSLQDLIKDVATAMRDVVISVTTSIAPPNQFFDSNMGVTGAVNGQYNGSQVVFQEPEYSANGGINGNVHTVTGYAYIGGNYTVRPDIHAAGAPGGWTVPYFLIRGQGRGNPYIAYVAAIRYALDELNVHTNVFDSSLVTADQTYDYVLPGTLGGVNRVEFAKTGYTTLQVLPRDWEMRPGRKLHLRNANLYVAFGWTLNLYGIAPSPLPTTLNGTVYGPRSLIVDLATEYLQRSSTRQADNQRAALKQQERLRYNRLSSIPNLRMVLP